LVLLGGETGKRPLVVMVGGEGLKKAKAGDIVKELAKHLGGGGGGKPEMASGQLVAKEGLEAAISSLKETLK
jgi:alanyl-tRNA synthetase